MGYKPPKGVRPAHLEGKRTGRPKGSRKWASAWRDILWGYQHAEDYGALPPTPGAALWQAYAADHLWEVHDWLEAQGVI